MTSRNHYSSVYDIDCSVGDKSLRDHVTDSLFVRLQQHWAPRCVPLDEAAATLEKQPKGFGSSGATNCDLSIYVTPLKDRGCRLTAPLNVAAWSMYLPGTRMALYIMRPGIFVP